MLVGVAAGAVGGAAAGVVAAHAGARDSADPLRDAVVVNALGGFGDPNAPEDIEQAPKAEIPERVLGDTLASGLTAMNITLGAYREGDEAFEPTVREVAEWDRVLRGHADRTLKVWTAADILRAKRERKLGVIYGFQDTVALGNRADRAGLFADLGVRVIQLTYNGRNRVGSGCLAADEGLTAFGREVVEGLNASRMMVDLSHSGTRTCLEAIEASSRPISINHTGCRALNDVPRNKTDEELRGVAQRGGFVGIYFMPVYLSRAGTPLAEVMIAHLEHALDVCGEDHVGLGTDGSVTAVDDLQAYRAGIAKQVEDRRARGISAPGESAEAMTFLTDLQGPGMYRELAERLSRRGHGWTTVEKVLGRNFLRHAREIWPASP